MLNIFDVIWKFRLWTNRQGHDLTESALLAGFVVLAAGAVMPGVASNIGEILSKISGMMPWAAPPGSAK